MFVSLASDVRQYFSPLTDFSIWGKDSTFFLEFIVLTLSLIQYTSTNTNTNTNTLIFQVSEIILNEWLTLGRTHLNAIILSLPTLQAPFLPVGSSSPMSYCEWIRELFSTFQLPNIKACGFRCFRVTLHIKY